ncbi:MAG: hypothetical protein WCA30_17465 [Dermatophilaceae bacterium]
MRPLPAHRADGEPGAGEDGLGFAAPDEPTSCPECLAPGEIVDRFVLASTDGPIEHIHVRCAAGHRFVLPTETHARATATALRESAPPEHSTTAATAAKSPGPF